MPPPVPIQLRRQDSHADLVVPTRLRSSHLFLKRAMDLVGAIVLLLLSAPVIGICGLLIRLQDGGPSIHRRRVLGKSGQFDALKLRTMRPDADEVLARDQLLRKRFEINFKLKNDPRITPLGKFLRRTSLDELPQLWNVLRGEMSLVGPRMISPQEIARYGDAAWIFEVLKPGLTGYWQVEGRQALSYAERIAMDCRYVENWSLLNDVQIVCKTPLRVVQGSGAF
jgi:UDP-galactose-lipid carrier transferase